MKLIKNKVWVASMIITSVLLPLHIMAQDVELTPQFKNGKWGYVNREGKKVIAFRYEGAKKFSEGLAAVRAKDGKWGYIDEKGSVIIPFAYEKIYDDKAAEFHKGVALVKSGPKYYFIDKTGQTVSPLYDYVGTFSDDGFTKVRMNGKHGFVDRSGKLVSSLYEKIGDFSEGLAWVELNKKIGYINEAGKEVIPCKYNKIGRFSINAEKLAVFQLDEKVGFIDTNGIESEIKSPWAELPVTFKGVKDNITIVDLKTGKKGGNTLVTLYGVGLDVIPLTFEGAADYSRMVNAAITTPDGKEYEAASLETGLLSLTLYFKTPLDPQFVLIYMKNDLDNKVRIDFK